jgi:hypothetical protein
VLLFYFLLILTGFLASHSLCSSHGRRWFGNRRVVCSPCCSTVCTRPVYYLCTDPEFCSEHCMPDLSSDEAPPFVALKSTDNIPIESSWNLFTNYVGLDIKQVIFLGKSLNYFHPGVELHVCVQVLVCSSFANSFQVISFTGCGPGSSKSAWMNSLNIGTLTKFGPSETNCYHLASRQTTSVTSQSGLV